MTCLSVSTDGSLLLSGSHDETVRLWDIQSKQCLRTVNHKGRRPRAPGSRPAALPEQLPAQPCRFPRVLRAILCHLFHTLGRAEGLEGGQRCSRDTGAVWGDCQQPLGHVR